MVPVIVIIVSVIVGWFIVDVIFDVIYELKEYNTKYNSNVPLTKLVNEVMYYTGGILHENGIKHYPTVELRYYRHKKWSGLHMGNGTIIIYTKSNSSILDLVDTTLHEISHHISMKTKCDEWVRYDELMKEYSYKNHPEEIKARNFSSKHIQPCIEHLEKGGIIKKG